jgi:DNA-binding transcriptional regulator YiaG
MLSKEMELPRHIGLANFACVRQLLKAVGPSLPAETRAKVTAMDTRANNNAAFRAWRQRLDLSVQQTALALGRTSQMIRWLDQGCNLTTLSTRFMTAVEKNGPLKPST